MKPTLKVTSDFTQDFNDIVKKFRNDEVLVGIPSINANRTEDQESGITNAAILAINEFGSPINNIPARPVMAIGIRNAQDQIAEELKKACKSALTKGLQAVDQYYERAGIVASNSVKKAINAQDGIQAPSEATLQARRAQGFSGTKALLVTGQLRNAITYVVKGK